MKTAGGSFTGSRFHLSRDCKCFLIRDPTKSASKGKWCLQTLITPYCSIFDKNYWGKTTQLPVEAASSTPATNRRGSNVYAHIRPAMITDFWCCSSCNREGSKPGREDPNTNTRWLFQPLSACEVQPSTKTGRFWLQPQNYCRRRQAHSPAPRLT